MPAAVLLKASDLQPLRDDPAYMEQALAAVDAAARAQHAGALRQHRIVDRVEGEFEGIRVSLLAGDDVPSGMRVFGNPPHTRAFVLFDGTTRALLALMDYGVLNSLRVGASAGLAAKYLAPKDAHIVGLLGSGWQAPPQAYAMKAALPNLQRIRVYSPTAEHRLSFALSMARLLEIEVEAASSAEAALRDADVVDLCAPGHFDVREPLFEPEWIKPGALVISMAANQYPTEFGVRTTRFDTEGLAAVVAGAAQPRRSAHETLIYQLEGGTVHDLFVARWGFEWARAQGLGTPFDLSA